MGQTQNKKITLRELKDSITTFSLDELGYIFGRYCGPHNVILREKVYEYEAAKQITDLVAREIARIEMDNILTDSLLTDTE